MNGIARRLWLVRHARPLVAEGTCYGQSEIAADADHTRASAHQLHAALPVGSAAFHSSPLGRCRQLAHELAKLRPDDPPPTIDARLAEMHFGVWEGRRWDSIARAELDAWTADFTSYCPGNGESLGAMLKRVNQALNEAREQRNDVVWITHAGVIRCVRWLIEHGERLPQASEWTMPACGFGEWFSLPLDPP